MLSEFKGTVEEVRRNLRRVVKKYDDGRRLYISMVLAAGKKLLKMIKA